MQYQAVMPILGFDDIEQYNLEQIDDIFFRLENANDESPSFTLIQPAALRDDYAFDLPTAAAQRLELKKPEDALVLNIMIVDTPLEKSHINFIAPLIFNKANGKMGQVILDSTKYPNYGLGDPLEAFLKPQTEAS